MGILLSVPLTLPAIGMAKDEVVRAFILIFVGQIFLNMNWAIIVDVSLASRVGTSLARNSKLELIFRLETRVTNFLSFLSFELFEPAVFYPVLAIL